MGAERLNDLILLYVHKDVPLDYDSVLDSYANDHPHRMLSSCGRVIRLRKIESCLCDVTLPKPGVRPSV